MKNWQIKKSGQLAPLEDGQEEKPRLQARPVFIIATFIAAVVAFLEPIWRRFL